MKTQLRGMIVGLFVLGALLLGAAALIWLGSANLFTRTKRFVVFFDESVSGLDPGAQVKVRGVRAGRVHDIRVASDFKSHQLVAVVTCEVEEDVLTDSEGNRVEVTDPPTLERLVSNGLRASVQYAGITGLRFVDLDLYDPAEQAPLQAPRWAVKTAKYPVVPALRSTYAEFTEMLSELATQLKKADLGELIGGLKSVMESLNHKIGEADLKGVGEKLSGATGAIAELVQSITKEGAVKELKHLLAKLAALADQLAAQVEPAGKEATAALKEAREALQSANRLFVNLEEVLGDGDGLGEEARRALNQLAGAAAAVRRLADFLERNPNALLTGKKLPERD